LYDELALESILHGKAQELFCYLLLCRDKPHSRDQLATLFWGDCTTAQSRKNLRQALWQLQAGLNSKHIRPDCLIVETEWIQLNSHADLWLDVAAFEQAYVDAEGVSGYQLTCENGVALEEAASLYKSDLLPGNYQDWCVFERERLQNVYISMLDKLMCYCEANSEYEKAITHGTRILSLDCAREQTHRRIMRLHYLSGDRTAALRQFERCAATLDLELGVKPETKTLSLYESIRKDLLDEVVLASKTSGAPSLPPTSISAAIIGLRQLRTALYDIERLLINVTQSSEKEKPPISSRLR